MAKIEDFVSHYVRHSLNNLSSEEFVLGVEPDIQSGVSGHLLGFEDEDLDSSPGWWAATVVQTACSHIII